LVLDDDNWVGICGYGPNRTKPTPGGVSSYNDLEDKPSINGETVEGAKTSDDYHISGGGGSRPTVDGEKLIFN
jgi:hypothetical protein